MSCARTKCTRPAVRGAGHGLCRFHAAAAAATNPHVDVTPVRAHVQHLNREGWTLAAIARAANVDPVTVQRINSGKYRQIRRDTARKIGAVRTTSTGKWSVDVTPTMRRLRSLQAAGYTQSELGRITGLDQTTISTLSLGKRERCTTAVAEQVHNLYSMLCAEPVADPTPLARERRWPVPMAWNDIDNLR